MKIAITGHTRGLGKAIYDLYPGAVGFSKSTGYNIGNEADAISIISQSIDCDVFINNAFHETAQQHLFEHMFKQWRYDNTKTIVNISSRAGYNLDWPGWVVSKYSNSKENLNKKFREYLLLTSRKCRMISFNPGYIDTDMIADKPDVPRLTTQQAAEMVAWCINQPSRIEIGELSVWMLGPKWSYIVPLSTQEQGMK